MRMVKEINQLILISDIYFLKTFTANEMFKVTKMSAALGMGKKEIPSTFLSQLDLRFKPLN
jgi:hypothetical protein